MPSAQHMQQLAAAFESYQARLAAAVAQTPPGPLRDHLSKSQELLARTYQEFQAAAGKHNHDLAAAARSAQEALAKAEADSAEAMRNQPRPKPRPVKPGLVHDPHLEEKLQVALRTPFGNRNQA